MANFHVNTAPVTPSMLGAIEWSDLKRAVRKLPGGYKKLFLLHDVFGYQHNEIARLLGCSTGCSKSQLHKARKRLRRLLQGEPLRAGAAIVPASWGNPVGTVIRRKCHRCATLSVVYSNNFALRTLDADSGPEHADVFCS